MAAATIRIGGQTYPFRDLGAAGGHEAFINGKWMPIDTDRATGNKYIWLDEPGTQNARKMWIGTGQTFGGPTGGALPVPGTGGGSPLPSMTLAPYPSAGSLFSLRNIALVLGALVAAKQLGITKKLGF